MVSHRIKVAYPVMLVLGGIALSFVPGMPRLRIHPDYDILVFLPPILYEAAAANSWKELWHWRRIIGSFAFIVVFITALVVGYIANTFIPGFSVALGFLIGGIVSPPDAVSAAAIMTFVKVPRRVSAMLEGESLFNDASSLIIVKFALIVIGTGQFVWHQAHRLVRLDGYWRCRCGRVAVVCAYQAAQVAADGREYRHHVLYHQPLLNVHLCRNS